MCQHLDELLLLFRELFVAAPRWIIIVMMRIVCGSNSLNYYCYLENCLWQHLDEFLFLFRELFVAAPRWIVIVMKRIVCSSTSLNYYCYLENCLCSTSMNYYCYDENFLWQHLHELLFLFRELFVAAPRWFIIVI